MEVWVRIFQPFAPHGDSANGESLLTLLPSLVSHARCQGSFLYALFGGWAVPLTDLAKLYCSWRGMNWEGRRGQAGQTLEDYGNKDSHRRVFVLLNLCSVMRLSGSYFVFCRLVISIVYLCILT